MKVLLAYGTTEGQTRRVADFVADRLHRQGHQVLAANVTDGIRIPDLYEFDAILIAASVHLGRYQASVVRFVHDHAADISAKTNAFLSVSLAAAGHDPDDIAGLSKCVADFIRTTGWTPKRIHHVAGAFRYTRYNLLKRWAMKYIAHRKGAPTDTSRDHELTDWKDLAQFADTFASAEVASPELLGARSGC
jgi:menaquinone-dependent protoporphyrinogen oxidase